VFGALVLANKLKWTFFALMLFFGLIFIALTVLCCVRYKKLEKSMETVLPDLLDESEKANDIDF